MRIDSKIKMRLPCSAGQGLSIGSHYLSRSENPGAPLRHSRRNGNPEPLLCVMKVVLKEMRWVRCRRPPAEYLLA